jgi:hypothetical protein
VNDDGGGEWDGDDDLGDEYPDAGEWPDGEDDEPLVDPDHGTTTGDDGVLNRVGDAARGAFAREDDADEPDDAGDWDSPPEIRTGRLGVISEWWSLKKQRRKRRKAANDGTVEWYLVDGAFPEPRYVKPTADGAGLPTHDHDGDTYLFPKDARVPSERSGMWVVVHERGQAEPINLRDPARDSVPADVLDEWLTMSVSSSSPGLLAGMDLDLEPSTILAGGILLIILYAIGSQVLTGGGPLMLGIGGLLV